MGYCTVDDVCAEFPAFQRNLSGDIQDSEIQGWIERAAARIAAALVQRGFDPDAPPAPLTNRQSALLEDLNAQAVVKKLGDVFTMRASLQAGEPALAAARGKSLESIIGEIRAGSYDAFFGLASRIGGIAGGEVPNTETLDDEGLSNFFGKFDQSSET